MVGVGVNVSVLHIVVGDGVAGVEGDYLLVWTDLIHMRIYCALHQLHHCQDISIKKYKLDVSKNNNGY